MQMPLLGQMMDVPLNVSTLLAHAARYAGDTEIVSRRIEGDVHRYTYRDCERRAKQLAQALMRLGVAPGERIGTLAWNGYRHLEAYYGVTGFGAVCHTINPRLFPEQIAYIVNHADDRYVLFDTTFAPLVAALAPRCPNVKAWIALAADADVPTIDVPLLGYESLVQAEDGDFEWPALDERLASYLCYTSGTTGHPKGALYSHRSVYLHAMGAALPDAMGFSAHDSVLPVVPMFHVNAWGIPHGAPLTGAKLVFPGKDLDGKSLFELMEAERVTFSAGVPTVWMSLLAHVKSIGARFSSLERTVIGGSCCPPSMLDTFEDEYGVRVIHAWGMTEMSPLGTLARLNWEQSQRPLAERRRLLQKQGTVICGVDMKIVGQDGRELPRDGIAFGDLHVRGPWVIDRYFSSDESPLVDGWFPTGDVATIDRDGFLNITDRSKDVIKSGGEWISSSELENVAVAHPEVAEAACIACRHPKWDERPLLVVVKRPGAALTREALLAFYEGKVAKWWIPDDVVFVDELPHTATGKLLKLKLREMFREHVLPTAGESAALQYAARAERAAGQIADVPDDTPSRPIARVAVIGAGTMGGGIAMNFVNAGIPVTLVESNAEMLERGLATIRRNYDVSVKKGKLSEAERDARMARLSPTLSYEAIADADLVVEAVFEDMSVKEQVFGRIDAVAKPGAILASNTSTLDLNRIARFTRRPSDVIGTHFFSPANVMKLLEVVRGEATAKDVLATVMRLARTIGKTAVVAGVCDGFIGNRMLEQYFRQAWFMLEEGALPERIDAAIERFGFAMGPFKMSDLAGNDISWAIRQRRYRESPSLHYPRVADRLCEAGRFGQKTSAGWYDYRPGEREPHVSNFVTEMIVDYSASIGAARRAIGDEEIVERLVYALVNEGAKILAEGIAAKATDIDVVYLNGYGFPIGRGGPMFYADTVGLAEVERAIRRYASQANGDAWEIAPLLADMARTGRRFCD